MRYWLIILALGCVEALHGQYLNNLAPEESEVTAGLMVSNLKSDTLQESGLSSYSIGFRTTAFLKNYWYFRASAMFSTRGYNTDDYNGKLRNRYVDTELNILREVLPGLRLEFGAAGHLLFSSSFSYQSPETGYRRISRRPNNWNSYADAFCGLEIRMEEKLSLNTRYYPSLSERQASSLLVQVAVSIDEPWATGTRALMKEHARKEINTLREGILLVRLKTLDRSVEALERMGEPLRAKDTRKKIDEQNQALIDAFDKEFNFCPVYFFYSKDSKEVISGNRSGKIFNSKGDSVSLDFPYSKIYFADTGPLAADTSTHFYTYERVQNGNFSTKRIKRKYAGQAMGFGALVLKDERFMNLRNPLPYYVKTWGQFFFLRKPDKFVALLNDKLYRYYNKVR
jgi:hypothetical protein